MKRLRILIVEDEFLIAMDLEDTVAQLVRATFFVKASVAATRKILDLPFDFAFLDMNVTNGKTCDLAAILERQGVPFAFISGSPQRDLPSDLRSAPFIAKPFRRDQIASALQCVLPVDHDAP